MMEEDQLPSTLPSKPLDVEYATAQQRNSPSNIQHTTYEIKPYKLT